MRAVIDGVRAPRQARARKTWENLLAAGAELLAERGYDGFTLPEVSRRAGVSNGAMYWRVDNKQALLTAIHEQFLDRVTGHIDRFYGGPDLGALDLPEAIEATVRHAAATVDLDHRLLRAIVLRSGSDPVVNQRATAVIHHHARSARAVLAPRLRSAGHPDPEAAIAFAHAVVFSALVNRVTLPEHHLEPQPSWDAFVTRLAAWTRAGLLGEIHPANAR